MSEFRKSKQTEEQAIPLGMSIFMGGNGSYSLAESMLEASGTAAHDERISDTNVPQQAQVRMPRNVEEEEAFVEKYGYYPDPLGR